MDIIVGTFFLKEFPSCYIEVSETCDLIANDCITWLL